MNTRVLFLSRCSAGPSRPWRSRVLYVIALVVTACGLVVGLAAATQILTGSGTGSASAGTVSIRVNGSGTHACDYGLLAPGGLAGNATCSLSADYRGSIPAYLSLTVRIMSKAGSGGAPLYDGSNTSGLTMTISDGHHIFTVPTGPGSTGGSCPAGFTCWTAGNDLAASYVGSTSMVFHRGDAITFTLNPFFVSAAGNSYQGGVAKVALVAQAVQAPANPLPATCNATTIGQPCPATGTFSWR